MEEHIDKLLALRRARPINIDPGRAALLVVDMQEYQVRKGYALFESMNTVVPGLLDYYVDRVEKVVEPNLGRLLPRCRQAGIKVIYTLYSSFNRDGSDLPSPIRAINEGVRSRFGDVVFPHLDHPGSRVVASLEPEDDDLVVVKNTSGVFSSTNLDFLLDNMGITQVLVCGVVTNMCVENAARIGSDLGFETVIIDDACAAWSPEVHKHSLRSFEMIFGRVMTTEQVMERLGQ